jgi:beta-1,4-mannosyl-glycoprotein beta-1,4-N-acetylglucosaminyltransferase
MKKKIVDCFTFFNELDLLEFRLTELDPYVDYFVIVESTKTFTGKPKPLYYNLNKFKFKKWEDKIVHKIVYDMPTEMLQEEIDKLVDLPEIRDIHWVREHHQRRQIGKVLEKMNLDYEDIVLVSDLDEIPDLRKLSEFSNLLKYGPVVMKQDWYIWNLNNLKNSDWRGSSAFYYSHYINNKDVFQKIRNLRWDDRTEFSVVHNGWHFSWFGNQEFIKQKMFSFAHTETANDFFKNKDNITFLVENSLPPQVPSEETKKLNYVDINPDVHKNQKFLIVL